MQFALEALSDANATEIQARLSDISDEELSDERSNHSLAGPLLIALVPVIQ